MKNKNKKYLSLIIMFFVFAICLIFNNFVHAATKYAPGETIIIGEFVYDDDYIATTTDCTISIYNPLGNIFISNQLMTALPNGWHFYSTSSITEEGVWPTTMTCGSVLGGDIANLDKTFVVGYDNASTTAISNSVWSNSATSSIANVVNTNTQNSINIASSSIISAVNLNTTNIVEAASSSIVASLPSLIWNYTGRTLSNFGSLVSDIVAGVWGATTRTLSKAMLGDGGNLAVQTDVTGAVSSINDNTNSASSSLASLILAVKAKTDDINWSDVTTVKNNVATLITEVGTGNITGIKTKTDNIVWGDVTGLVTTSGLIKAKTDLVAWADIAAIKTKTDNIVWGDVTGIKTKTDTIVWTDIASLAANISNASSSLGTSIAAVTTNVNAHTDSQLASAISAVNLNTNTTVASASSSLSSLITSLPATIWSYSTRTLTSAGGIAAEIAANVWNTTTRTLTSLTLSSQSPWTVSTSDFGTITAGSNYLSTVTTVYNGTLMDSLNIPTVTIYDPNRNVIANNVVMTRVATGTYSYSYTTASNAPAGTWESVFSATVETGKTLPGNDYWTVVTTPAQVIINSISDNTVPSIGANVTITNEGLSGNEYQYEWCVVSSINNTCGGGDDIFHAVAAKYINAGEDFNTTLTATVPSIGNYYFKVIVYFGTDSSGASRTFTTIAGSTGGNTGGGGSSGGGGGGSSSSESSPSVCRRADFNCDKKVNTIDFSILLYFWKTKAPFSNKFVDINKDNKVDSVDFSILLYEWDKKK